MASMTMSVNVDFIGGTTIEKAVSEALEFSRRNNCFVDFSFNGIPMNICALSGIDHMEDDIETYKKMYFSMLEFRKRKAERARGEAEKKVSEKDERYKKYLELKAEFEGMEDK